MAAPDLASGPLAYPLAPRLVLRADGGPAIGLGHVMRLLALAEALRPQFATVTFAVREPADSLRELLQAADMMVVEVPAQALTAEANWLVRELLKPDDVLVLDGYGFDLAYQQTLRPAVRRLLCLDDLHAFPFAADVVLNPAGGVPATAYDLRQPGAQLLTGPAYAPLRAAFRPPTGAPATPPDTVLLCLGGADPRQLTQAVASQLLALPGVAHVHAVVGSAYAAWPDLAAWAAGHADRLTLHRQLSAADLASLMHRCGAAVCSPSTVSYEYCAAGGGLLLTLPTADNQHDLDQYLRAAGLALPYPSAPNVLAPNVAGQLAEQLRAAQRQHFDGQVPARLRQLVAGLLLSPPLRLRPVTAADSNQLLAWTNEPETRRQSFDPRPVLPAAHESWLAAQLGHPGALLLLAEDTGGQPAGLIRFAGADGYRATLSYSLDPAFRGRGAAAPLLRAGTLTVLEQFAALREVVGHVRATNVASVRAFRRAGFEEYVDAAAGADSLSFRYVR